MSSRDHAAVKRTSTPRIRVLWFVQSRPPAVLRHLGIAPNPGPASWIDSLRSVLSSFPGELELIVASPGVQCYAPFSEGGTTFVNLPIAGPSESRSRRVVHNWIGSLRATQNLPVARAAVAAFAPDLIHVHGTEHGYGLVAGHAGVPAVVSLQGLLGAYVHTYFAGLGLKDVVALTLDRSFVRGASELHNYAHMRARAHRERVIIAQNRYFVGRTEWDRAFLSGLQPNAVYYHCDEIMRPVFYDAPRKVDSAVPGFSIFSTSSSMIFKGTERLLDAVAILKRAGMRGLRLRVAGVPPGQQVERLYRRRARRLGIEACVEWLGRIDADALACELSRADVFAYPSHNDNSPNAVVEAMLVGTPIVASRVGGIPSLLRDGEEGLLFPDNDAHALATRLQALLNDRSLAAKLGERARRTAKQRNDPMAIATRTVEIYQEVLEREGRRR